MYKLLLFLLLIAFTACRPSRQAATDFLYFEQNLDTLNTLITKLEEPVIKPNDLLTINVSSATLNQEQAMVFNLLGGGGGGAGGGMGAIGYLVDYDGTVTIPILGKIPAAGLTKNQLSAELTRRLEPHVKNPVINIRFLNFRVLMMGEVAGRGWQTFPNERATIVEAILQSGGLTDQGERENILLIRESPQGVREYHRLNLNDARIFASPYYQLQQNDIVYVLPNKTRLLAYQRQNSPLFRDLPVITGIVTSLMAMVLIVLTLLR